MCKGKRVQAFSNTIFSPTGCVKFKIYQYAIVLSWDGLL